MKNLKTLSIITLALALGFSSCKKEEDEEVVAAPKTDQVEPGANDETARDEYDGAIDDVFNALNGSAIQTGRSAGQNGVILPCGVVSIDSTGSGYKFNYGGTQNCNKRVLSGSITATLITGNKWEDKGAQLQLTFTGYTVLFTTNNQTLTFDGTLVVTNKDGGLGYQVLSPDKKVITHQISGTVQITFDATDKRNWVITKKRILQSSDGTEGGITWTLDADNGNIAETGTSKNGSPFTTTVNKPLKFINCSTKSPKTFEGPYIAIEGEWVYAAGINTLTAEAGYSYDATAKQASFEGDCSSEGYKLTYLVNGQKTTSFQYY